MNSLEIREFEQSIVNLFNKFLPNSIPGILLTFSPRIFKPSSTPTLSGITKSALFMIFAKGIKTHRVAFTICVIAEYICLLYCFPYSCVFHLLFMVFMFVLLKSFYKEKSRIVLHPENDDMEDLIYDNVTILGIVKGLFRKF